MTTSPITTTTDTAALIEVYADAHTEPEPDPLLDDLARLLNDPRLPDMLAESVRALLAEQVYQLRVYVGEVAA